MKKIKISIALAGIAMMAFAACRKIPDNVSQVEKASWPTITILGSQFYSIPVGGSLPAVSATAYDSVLMESYPVALDASSIDVNTPGLYVVPITAKNKFGYINSTSVNIAVTNIDPSWNLAGLYKRASNGAPVNLTQVANGLYEVDDVGGAPTFQIKGYFIQIDDSTINFPLQPTDAGDLDCLEEALNISGGDTSYQWKVENASFGKALRVFEKQ
jgi:hypothetical protein